MYRYESGRVRLLDERAVCIQLAVSFVRTSRAEDDSKVVATFLAWWSNAGGGVLAEALGYAYAEAVKEHLDRDRWKEYATQAIHLASALEFRSGNNQSPGEKWTDSFLLEINKQLS